MVKGGGELIEYLCIGGRRYTACVLQVVVYPDPHSESGSRIQMLYELVKTKFAMVLNNYSSNIWYIRRYTTFINSLGVVAC